MDRQTSAATRIVQRVDAETRRLYRQALLRGLAWVWLGLSAPLAVAAMLDLQWTWRETTTVWLTAAWVVVALVASFASAIRIVRRQPTSRDVALRLEAADPTFMDSLICAVELARRPDTEWSTIDRALLANVDARLAASDVAALLVDRRGRWQAVLAALTALVLLVAWPMSPFAAKVAAQVRDYLRGESTGLVVVPGDIELARGDDLSITATVKRGPDAARIVIDRPGGRYQHDMYARDGGQHGYEEYAIEESFRYAVETPTLRSRWYRVTLFQKPSIEAVAVHLAPPAYTGAAPQHVNELRNLSSPVGTMVRFDVRANLPVTVTLTSDGIGDGAGDAAAAPGKGGEGKTFTAVDEFNYVLTFPLLETLRYRLTLTDRAGHAIATDREYRLEALPDYAPVVQIYAPEDNAVFDRTADATVSLNATDDYGLATVDLVYAVNGAEPVRVPLLGATATVTASPSPAPVATPNADAAVNPAADPATETAQATPRPPALPREVDLLHVLKLADLKVDYGDVVTYWVEAADTAEPVANLGESDIRFLEIRPPDDPDKPDESDDAGTPMEGEMLSLRVSDLIEDQKQLIRQTYALRRVRDEARRADLVKGLAKSAADLEVASRQRYNDLLKLAGGQELGDIGDWFKKAVEHMGSAKSLLENGMAEPSVPWQQDALAKLIAVEIELLKNSKKMKQQQASSQSQQQQSQQADQRPPDKEAEREQQLKELSQALDQMDTLIQRQTALNDTLKQRQQADAAESAAMARREGQIADDARALQQRLQQTPGTTSAQRELNNAGDRMDEANAKLKAAQPGSALKDGALAEQYLQRSRQLLEDLRKNLSSSQLEAAKKQLDALRQEQQNIQDATQQAGKAQAASPGSAGGPTPEQRRAMAEQQAGTRQELDRLTQQLQQATDALEKDQPDAARQVRESLRKMEDSQVDGAMKRAENALRYGRYGKADESQQQARQGMDELANQLDAAIHQSLAPSPEQVSAMLQQALSDMEKLQAAMDQETDPAAKQALREEIAKRLKEMADRLGDGKMTSLADRAAGLAKTNADSGSADSQLMGVLQQTSRLLETRLLESSLAQKLRLSRLTGREAPDAYRKLVDEYFKNLSDVGEAR